MSVNTMNISSIGRLKTMPAVTIKGEGKSILTEVPREETLLPLLRAHFPDFAFPCGGNHSCGKCLVRITGKCSSICADEQKMLPTVGNFRLACFARVMGDCTVELPPTHTQQRIKSGYSVALQPGEPLYEGDYGAAVDIGTTTVVGYLFRKDDAEPVQILAAMNAQKSYGSDVLSRIAYCNAQTVRPLQELICWQLDGILSELCRREGISPSQLGGACITGNTTMLHILAGLEPRSLGEAPFAAQSLFGRLQRLPLKSFPDLLCYLPPCISAYIGADISCSILASGMAEKEGTTLLLDAGTNGEIVLKHQGRMLCCSTAAGPAFEGTTISCGMQAQDGAIEAVWNVDGKLRCSVIGGEPAIGICGSGLINAVFAAKAAGILDRKGRPQAAGGLVLGDSGVTISRADLNAVLLAKGAIRAGIETLLDAFSVTDRDIAQVILCGGFGSYLRPESAVGIGMFPSGFLQKTVSIGNAAGAGASMVLQDRTMAEKLLSIASSAETLELSYSKFFNQKFTRCMFLPE